MTENKYQIPDWIKELQENSWQIELLISGGAIFTLFQLEDLFLDFMMRIKMIAWLPGTGIFIILGMLAIKLLTLGFLGHLLLRSYWLGLLCVNYVFPKGIAKFKQSNKPPFKNKFLEGDSLQDEIHKVDSASGLVMYVSVLATIVIAGFIVLAIFFLTLPSMFIDLEDWYFEIIITALFTYHIDLFLFGFLRKIPGVSYLVFPFFWMFDRLSFRVFYAKSLRLFSSNVSKTKTFIGIFTVTIVGMFFTYNAVYRIMHWPNMIDAREHRWTMAEGDEWMTPHNYMDLANAEGLKSYSPSIQSEIITENYLKIYIPYNKRWDETVPKDDFISNYVGIDIDDSTYSDINWANFWADKNELIGLRTLIDIRHLEKSHHVLTIFNTTKKEESAYTIPFWID